MKDKLNFEARYPHSPARVWTALTDPSSLAKWLFPNDFVPVLGHKFQLVSVDGRARIACQVVELEPQKRLSFTWDGEDEDPPAIVSWTLQPDDDGGTRLTLEHQLLEAAASYVLIEAGLNWRYLINLPLPLVLQALAGSGRPRAPIVYVEEECEAFSDRIAGLTRGLMEEVHAAALSGDCQPPTATRPESSPRSSE